jgi:type VI secretion system protein ImpG
MFALYAAPAVNLFPKTADRVPIVTNQHEYQIIPTAAIRWTSSRIPCSTCSPTTAGHGVKERVSPLYASPSDYEAAQSRLHYTIRRLPRRRTANERRFGSPSDYVGTDMFISITMPEAVLEEDASRSSACARCAPTAIWPTSCRSARAARLHLRPGHLAGGGLRRRPEPAPRSRCCSAVTKPARPPGA